MATRFLIGFAALVVVGAGLFFYHPNFQDHQFRTNIPKFVQSSIDAYKEKGVAAFDDFNTEEWVRDEGETYMFVLNAMNGKAVAHGAVVSRSGARARTIRALSNYVIAVAKEYPEGTWVTYDYENPRTGKKEVKHSFIKMYDDYVFGSGEYRRNRHESNNVRKFN